MNTIGYVARQFDVLAAPRTTGKRRTESSVDLQRVSSWSTTANNSQHRTRHPSPKRSQSTPSLRNQPSRQHSLPSPDPSTPSKSTLPSVLDRIFFIRFFLLIWDNIKSSWSRLLLSAPQLLLAKPRQPPTPQPVLSQAPTPPPTPDNASIQLHVIQSSRSPTPQPRRSPFHLQKTLVLDLDETLIHSTSRPIPQYSSTGSGLMSLMSFSRKDKLTSGHMVEVVLGDRSTLYHVYKRPFVDFFLRTVSSWYTLVIFTASVQEYADPVIDWLDAGRGILSHRFFRDSCTQLPNGSYTKDLSVVDEDLSRVCLVDNSPVSYSINQANGIPIEGWTQDPYDEALLDLLPVLDSLRFTSDVRRVLGLRTATFFRGLNASGSASSFFFS
ncbi:NLI interacting factor-like phosphatase-domain-containing protein [Panaeolus papilionaceus]|nr:NLI interacting factor-like phosphatase-domain-containing protein [Panaeolus papilionaceus]